MTLVVMVVVAVAVEDGMGKMICYVLTWEGGETRGVRLTF